VKILFLSQRVPYPPNKGDKLRSYNEIKYLAQNHQVSLACLSDNQKDLQHARQLKEFCESVEVVFLPRFKSKLRALLALLSAGSLSLAYFYSDELQALVERKIRSERFDLIFIYCSSMAQYVMHIKEIPKVIDFVDVDSEKWRQYSIYAPYYWSLLYRIESRRLRKYERLVVERVERAFLVSEKETEDFRQLVHDTPLLIAIANGVDSSLFKPSCEPDRYDPNALVFTGAMDYFANVEAVLYFVRQIMPLIQKRLPHVRLYVVGSSPAQEILALAKENPQVTVTGYVDSVRAYVVGCAVMVAPMRIARGGQNKILEAMAMGGPVVTSSLGLEGIAATPGIDIFVADDPERFAAQVVQLMQNRALRMEVAGRARETVLQCYNWNRNLQKLESVVDEVGKVRKNNQTARFQ